MTAGFGAELRAEREARGWHQREMAEFIGENAPSVKTSQTLYSKWERGVSPPLSPYKVFEIERALDLNPGQLSAHLGYLPWPFRPSVDVALIVDPDLDDESRPVVRAVYRLIRGRTADG